MPRSFDSDERDPTLRFAENVTCPRCGEVFDGDFEDPESSLSVSDMGELPAGRHLCPECGLSFMTELTGWSFYGEPG